MSLLLNERPVVLQPSLVRRLGILEAALVQQLHYWAQRATCVHDGERWVYKTYADWADEIGVSAKQARGALDRMRDGGIVIAIQNPTEPRDRTLWWRVAPSALDGDGPPGGHAAEGSSSNAPRGRSTSAPAGSSNAGASGRRSESTAEMTTQSPPDPPAREGRVTFYRRPVPSAVVEKACEACDYWAERTSQTVRHFDAASKPTESLKRVIGAILDYPEVGEHFRAMIDRRLADPWWPDDRPSIGVVFGPKVVEQSLALAQRPPLTLAKGGRRFRNGHRSSGTPWSAQDMLDLKGTSA